MPWKVYASRISMWSKTCSGRAAGQGCRWDSLHRAAHIEEWNRKFASIECGDELLLDLLTSACTAKSSPASPARSCTALCRCLNLHAFRLAGQDAVDLPPPPQVDGAMRPGRVEPPESSATVHHRGPAVCLDMMEFMRFGRSNRRKTPGRTGCHAAESAASSRVLVPASLRA